MESVTSLLIKPWWHVEIIRMLGRSDFSPAPSVEPVVLWLARRAIPLVSDSDARLYREFISDCFGTRGNTVRRCLGRVLTGRQLNRLAHNLRFDRSDAPSALHFDQWLGLFRFIRTVKKRPR